MNLVEARVRACRWAGGNTLLQVLVMRVTITLQWRDSDHAAGVVVLGG